MDAVAHHGQRVVITGYGAICSLGENSEQIWQAIRDKKNQGMKYGTTREKASVLNFSVG